MHEVFFIFFTYNEWGYFQVESFDKVVRMIIVFEHMADSYYQLWACEMVNKDILIMLQTFSVTLYSWLGVTSFIPQKRASLGAE